MANVFDELTTMIGNIVLKVTRYNVPRLGIISSTDDKTGQGRVLAHVPSLGWDTDDKGAWCFPKDKKGLTTLKRGDYVIVEFLDGNRDLPMYSGKAFNMKNMLPKNYDGNPLTQVLFEDPEQEFALVYNGKDKKFSMGKGDESYVKGDTFETEFQKTVDYIAQLKADFANWVVVPNDGGGALKAIIIASSNLKPTPTATGILSTKIKGE
jgi:hypothetical protein